MARPGRGVGGLILAGAGLLLLSLFLTWSHQLSPGFLAHYGGSDALRGVPRDPDAWQVYSVVDILLALLAVTLGVLARARVGAAIRGWVLAALAIAIAFTLHALAKPPTNGATIFDPARRAYAANAPGAGIGETVALIGLLAAALGLLLSLLRR